MGIEELEKSILKLKTSIEQLEKKINLRNPVRYDFRAIEILLSNLEQLIFEDMANQFIDSPSKTLGPGTLKLTGTKKTHIKKQ